MTKSCVRQSVKYEMLRNSQTKIKLIMDRYENKDGFIVLLRSRRQTAKHKMKTPSSTETVRTHCAGSYRAPLLTKMLPTGRSEMKTGVSEESTIVKNVIHRHSGLHQIQAVCISGIYCLSLETIPTSMHLDYHLYRSLKQYSYILQRV